MTGGFLVLMALYEMFEYAFCYGDDKAKFAAELQARAEDLRQARESDASSDAANELRDSDDESTEFTQLLPGESLSMEIYRTSNENTQNNSDLLSLSHEGTVNAHTEL